MLRNKTLPRSGIPLCGKSVKLLVFSLTFAFCALGFLPSFAQEQFVYDAQGKRNPFIPLLTPDGRFLNLEQTSAPEGLSLEGITYDKYGRSYAVVNGAVVAVGDTVGDYQVLKVEQSRVIFIKDGEPRWIELKKEEP
ncbi:MAG: hypothetical protein NT066_02215 [Candidatus Omnitrophica bacterium]|nr:hypothetical protein [Candidatus Omnitrophota bacterium]